MKRQHLIYVLAAIVAVALVAWIANNTYWEEYETRLGPQGEALTNPFYASQRLADLLGAHTRLRHEIVRLPPTNAVIVLGDWNWSMISERRGRLERWVEDGGRLVVSRGALTDPQFKDWAGVAHERLANKTVQGLSDYDLHTNASDPTRHWEICDLATSRYLNTHRQVSWRIVDARGHAQVLRIPIGRGSVTIINAEPFIEQAPLCGDDAQLFVTATQLHAGDSIEFLTEKDGESLLQLVWKYGAPVVVLCGALIALWLWRFGVRFGPLMAEPEPARRSLAEQIRGTGRFTMRFGGGQALYAATVRALDETAARRVPHYERLSGEERVATLAPLTGLSTSELTAALDPTVEPRRPLHQRNSHELRKAIATLELARRHMAQTTKLNN